MTKIDQLLKTEIAAIPARFFEASIARKLAAAEIPDPEAVARGLTQHILAGNKEAFVYGEGHDGPLLELSLAFSEDDLDEVKSAVHEFMENRLPKVIEGAADATADATLRILKRNWPAHFAAEYESIWVFRQNLEDRWGTALSLLRMLLVICREVGQQTARRSMRSKRRQRSHVWHVLIPLHARACQITAEIIALLEAGFAEGAMARWRTLYEISVVATLIAEFGESLAERYVAHEAVEAKRAMEEYRRCHAMLGYKPLSKRATNAISKDYAEVMTKYGREFASFYGWAAHHLGMKKPIFGDLEAAAGRASMRSYYKMASYNVHASPKGIFFRLGLPDKERMVVAGATNAGLTDPGQNAALSLMSITALLFGPRWTFNDIVTLKVIVGLNNEIPRAFFRADRKLQRDDAWLRQSNGRTTGKA